MCLYVSTKILVEHLFLEYLFVSFSLFWWQKQPPEVFCKKGVLKFCKFHRKTLALESLFNKIACLLGHFEEYLNCCFCSKQLIMQRLCSAYFAQIIICFPKIFLPIGSNFPPFQSKEDNIWISIFIPLLSSNFLFLFLL